MDNNDEILKEAESIINNAASVLDTERKDDHVKYMEFLTKEITKQIAESHNHTGEVFVGFIYPDDKHNFISDEATVSLFFGFEDKDEAIECFSDKETAVMAHHLQGKQDTAMFMVIHEKGYDIASLVADDCLTVSRVVNGGTANQQLSSEHTNLQVNDKAQEFFDRCALNERQEDTIRALIEFHHSPAVLQANMPNVYAVMVEKVKEKIEKFKREEGLE